MGSPERSNRGTAPAVFVAEVLAYGPSAERGSRSEQPITFGVIVIVVSAEEERVERWPLSAECDGCEDDGTRVVLVRFHTAIVGRS